MQVNLVTSLDIYTWMCSWRRWTGKSGQCNDQGVWQLWLDSASWTLLDSYQDTISKMSSWLPLSFKNRVSRYKVQSTMMVISGWGLYQLVTLTLLQSPWCQKNHSDWTKFKFDVVLCNRGLYLRETTDVWTGEVVEVGIHWCVHVDTSLDRISPISSLEKQRLIYSSSDCEFTERFLLICCFFKLFRNSVISFEYGCVTFRP